MVSDGLKTFAIYSYGDMQWFSSDTGSVAVVGYCFLGVNCTSQQVSTFSTLSTVTSSTIVYMIGSATEGTLFQQGQAYQSYAQEILLYNDILYIPYICPCLAPTSGWTELLDPPNCFIDTSVASALCCYDFGYVNVSLMSP